MQVVCGNCQLNFQAPEGASGLMCPICRSPLRPAQAATDAAINQNIIEWNGGSLDDLIAYLSGPAVAARVEVLPAKGDIPVGEVHLLAGGVSECLFDGKSTDDALDRLRAVSGARFRIEPRLPSPVDGDLGKPGPDSGTLDARPLAHLMRYCEEYVITCGIEVWRGSETARVEYRKGEISGVTVGGIDAPERLAEVMQWASGNYRLTVPRLTMPDVVPKQPARVSAPAIPAPTIPTAAPAAATPARPPATPSAARPPATPSSARPAAMPPFSSPPVSAPAPAQASAPVPAPTPSPAPAARAPLSAHASRTIFGMPALDIAGLKASEAAAVIARQAAAAAPSAPAHTPPSIPAAVVPVPPVVAAPAPSSMYDRGSATKTIFGVPAPKLPQKPADRADEKAQERAQEEAKAARAALAATPSADGSSQRPDRKTGARKTIVPAPAIIPPPATLGEAPPPAAVSATPATTTEAARTTHQGYGGQSGAAEVVPTKAPAAEDRTLPVRAPSGKRSHGIPVWTYVGVGFLFGLALLGIYQLVGVLAH